MICDRDQQCFDILDYMPMSPEDLLEKTMEECYDDILAKTELLVRLFTATYTKSYRQSLYKSSEERETWLKRIVIKKENEYEAK